MEVEKKYRNKLSHWQCSSGDGGGDDGGGGGYLRHRRRLYPCR